MFDKERKDLEYKIKLGEDAKEKIKKVEPLYNALNKNIDNGEKAKHRLAELEKMEKEMAKTVKLGEKADKTLKKFSEDINKKAKKNEKFWDWFDEHEKDLGS